MAHQHCVAAGRIEAAIDGVMQCDGGERTAAIELEWLVEHEVAFVGRLRAVRNRSPGSVRPVAG